MGKILKRIGIGIAGLLLVSSIGGYFYFRGQFTAPPNQMTATTGSFQVPFEWVADSLGNELNPYAAMVLPVKIPGASDTFAMQFDLGAVSSLFYQNKLDAINQRYHNIMLEPKDEKYFLTDYTFHVASMNVHTNQIRIRQFENSGIDWNGDKKTIIGTLGADLIDGRIMIIDYPRRIITFADAMPDSLLGKAMIDFKWNERKILLPATIQGENTDLYFDTGSSAFAFLTSKSDWTHLAKAGGAVTSFGVNSWGKTLTAYNAPTDASAIFGTTSLPVHTVTYIEGTSFIQNLLMRFSGMGGMTGNKLFINHVLVIDTKAKKFMIIK